jgi:tetratricopeptide (TPR) repeat protein
VTTPAQRAALSELQAARPVIARLASEQNSEDRAADLIEGWSAVEAALRSLIGGSALSGRSLIHEVRSRHIITLEQANVLAEFEAARTRAERMAYEPTDSDVRAAQEAFRRLDWTLSSATVAEAATPLAATPRDVSVPVPEPASVPSLASAVPTPAGPDWLRWGIAALAVLAVVGLGTWAYMRSTSESTLERAVALYRQGQREQAAAAFERAARENPQSALPHVYLSRMARDVGNLTLARDEANRAIQAEPANALALREMGAYLLTAGNYELARRFYVRAVQADPTDKTAQGYLGCSLVRLGRRDEGQRWLTRAGPGNWSSCATMAPGTAMPGMPAPGMPGPGMPPPGSQPPIQPNP